MIAKIQLWLVKFISFLIIYILACMLLKLRLDWRLVLKLLSPPCLTAHLPPKLAHQ